MNSFQLIKCLVIFSIFIFSTTIISSCAPKRKVIDDADIFIGQWEFVKDVKITKQEIINRLGEPMSSYENGRIVIYSYRKEEKDKLYNLVLVFNDNNVLARHSIVQLR